MESRERPVLVASPSGAFIVAFVPGAHVADVVQAYDVTKRQWLEVANPGIAAWEPMVAR